MTEKETTSINADFLVDAKKDAKLLKCAEQIFKNPHLLSEIKLEDFSSSNPALASKVLLAAYTRALLAEANAINLPKNQKEELLEEQNERYKETISAFLEQNREALKNLSAKQEKGGE